MTKTYKATGINLKGMPLGESDRLLTVLTKEFGVIRVAAPGARKHQSTLRGRSGIFVVNELLIASGKNLDKIVQAESIASFPNLSQDLRKLTAGQYLAELALYQALSDQPQEELFQGLYDHLSRLDQLPGSAVLAYLLYATFHLLTLAGIVPDVYTCCLTRQPIAPDFSDRASPIGFSTTAGGVIQLTHHHQDASSSQPQNDAKPLLRQTHLSTNQRGKVGEGRIAAAVTNPLIRESAVPLNALQLALLQQIARLDFIQADGTFHLPATPFLPQDESVAVWLSIERLLRQYAQYHFERPIRSATLIDTCFLPLPQTPLQS